MDTHKADTSQRLLLALAEELKLPLLQIARAAELGRLHSAQAQPPDTLAHIETAATRAMWFIDSYLLSHQLHNGQVPLQLEPVVVSGVLHDVAHALSGLAKQYDCQVELAPGARSKPVMAHREGLHAALMGLGVTFITGTARPGKTRVILAAHQVAGDTTAGVFGSQRGLSQSALRDGRALYGRAHQALRETTANPGAGVFIADSLFTAMATELRVAHHHNLTGLAATLHQSQQLALV